VWHSSDPERMHRVLAAWDEHLVHPYLPRTLGRLLRGAGFAVRKCEAVPLLNAGYDENTFSAGLMGFVAAFVPGRHGLTESDASAWVDDLVALGEDYFFSLNRYMFLAVR
jgi:arsenite methyltransferase